MMDNNYNLLSQINSEADETLAETIWGKPANDIITGINNNSIVPANRSIWELVQNARDVSYEGCKAEIRFIRKENEFVFEHNGQPFDRKSIQSLIIQTSSKVRNDIVKVGQYGTGFLTTHKFGLRFKLEGALKVVSNQNLYYNFGKDEEEYIIDRSFTDRGKLSSAIQKQVDIEQAWGKDLSKLSSTPAKKTVFTYIHDHEIEKQNVKDAFEKSPVLTPFVLALNQYVGSIVFEDEVDHTCMSYSIGERTTTWESDSMVLEKVSIIHKELSKQINLYLLKSKIEIDDATKESKVTVIMPWSSTSDNSIDYNQLTEDIPQLYLYLPLLGTENWGWNYIIHAPGFTCDKDTRDSLLFVGNGQNNDYQAEQNRNLIALAGRMIKEYFALCLSNIDDRKYLGRVHFMPAPQERLKNYYSLLQKEWVSFFEQQPLVAHGDGYIKVCDIKVLDTEMYGACGDDSLLLDAVYTLLCKEEHHIVLPEKQDLIHWSRYINEWYEGEKNTHTISLIDICDKIKCTELCANDISWLHSICLYLKEHPHHDVALKSIVPNQNLKLIDVDLVRPVNFNPTFCEVMRTLVPTEVERFVHDSFTDIMSEADEYDREKVKTALTAFVTGLNNNNSALKNAIISSSVFDKIEYEKQYLNETTVHAILDLYKMLLPLDGTGFTSRMFRLLEDFYHYYPDTTDRIEKESFDIRNCYIPLINDSLFHFTLMEDKNSLEDWIFNMVRELNEYSEANSFLRNYTVYPNQKGVYKYSCQLKKQQMMPERLKEIYHTICEKDVREQLVAVNYQDNFVETATLNGQELAEEIQKPFTESDVRSIERSPHQQLYVEIIEKFSLPVEGLQWRTLFPAIYECKANLMLSVINSPQKRESIFQIMKVQDSCKLNAIAELAKRDDLERVIQLGKDARDREIRDKNDFEFKKKLGLYVETYLLKQLDIIIGDNKLNVSVIDDQGGQDLKVLVNDKVIYYIEVKSRWETDRSVLMSTLQHKTSYREKEHYALCAVDMSHFDQSLVEQHKYPELDIIKDNISVLMNIGVLNDRMRDAVEEHDENEVHIAGGYQVLVSQNVIQKHAIPFDSFIVKLKEFVKDKMKGREIE